MPVYIEPILINRTHSPLSALLVAARLCLNYNGQIPHEGGTCTVEPLLLS